MCANDPGVAYASLILVGKISIATGLDSIRSANSVVHFCFRHSKYLSRVLVSIFKNTGHMKDAI